MRKSAKRGRKAAPERALGIIPKPGRRGLVAAELAGDGRDLAALGEVRRRPFGRAEREAIAAAEGSFGCDRALSEMIEDAHADLLARFAPPEVIGFHGVTLAHDPASGRGFQAGNGGVLAEALDVPVVWDLRAADLKLGGQGSPIGAFFYHALARHLGFREAVLFVEIGDLAHLVLADSARDAPEEEGALLAFDAGPGLPAGAPEGAEGEGREGEDAGAGAAAGDLEAFLAAPFFGRIPPRAMPWPPAMALPAPWRVSLAGVVAAAAAHLPRLPRKVVITGAGSADRALVRLIAAGLGREAESAEALGLDGGAIPAQAMAHLALRLLRGLPVSAPGTTGVPAPIGGAQISRPSGRFRGGRA